MRAASITAARRIRPVSAVVLACACTAAGVVATVALERQHEGVAHEYFLPSGPFAILPLAGNRSGIVWTEPGDVARAICAQSEGDFTNELAAKVGYAPLLPATLPGGAELLTASTQPDPWGPYTWLFPVPVPWVDYSKLPDRVTSLYFHRGFDRLVVREWPLPGGIGNSTHRQLDKYPRSFYRKTALTTGAFAGRTARTWFDDGGVGLYVQKGSFAVLVTGDLTRSDALALAGSLHQ